MKIVVSLALAGVLLLGGNGVAVGLAPAVSKPSAQLSRIVKASLRSESFTMRVVGGPEQEDLGSLYTFNSPKAESYQPAPGSFFLAMIVIGDVAYTEVADGRYEMHKFKVAPVPTSIMILRLALDARTVTVDNTATGRRFRFVVPHATGLFGPRGSEHGEVLERHGLVRRMAFRKATPKGRSLRAVFRYREYGAAPRVQAPTGSAIVES